MQTTNTNQAAEAAITELNAHIDDVDSFAKAAQSTLTILRSLNEAEYRRESSRSAELQRKLEMMNNSRLQMVEEKKRKTAEIVTKSNHLSALSSTIDSLHANINNLHSTIHRANEEIADNNRRQSNAVYDLIPFHGIFSAIISGDAKRAIPYYSQIDGVVSAIANGKAEAEHQLHRANNEMKQWVQQRNDTEQSIKREREQLEKVQRELSVCEATINDYEKLRTTTGQRLTTCENASSGLKKLANDVLLLEGKLDRLAKNPRKLLLQRCINGFRALGIKN